VHALWTLALHLRLRDTRRDDNDDVERLTNRFPHHRPAAESQRLPVTFA
jgi:hypothetical protein